jgi:F-type H+-transporting ATPase subunit b
MARWIVFLFVAVAVFCFATAHCVPAAHADEAHETSPAHGVEKTAGGHAGEENPSVFGWALDLAIWTLVVFLLLLWVLGRYAWKPMLQGLQNREQAIRQAIEDAAQARAEADRMRGELQAEMNKASEKIHDMMEEARRDAQRTTDEMLAKTRGEIQDERERLHREIDLARDQALQQIWTHAAQLATLVSAKAIRRQLTPDDHRRLVDEAIGELRQTGKAS